METVPLRYLPKRLTKKDKAKQVKMLETSRRLYKKHKYYTRKAVDSFKSKPSNHVREARKLYGVDKMTPNKELAEATGCSISALKKIVRKGEGAYFSSGSRPNQTAQSWGLARLASSITGGKSAAVDYHILESGCNHNKMAFKLANQSRKQYNHGQGRTKRVRIS
jgi:Family of unknown function (DUF5824)